MFYRHANIQRTYIEEQSCIPNCQSHTGNFITLCLDNFCLSILKMLIHVFANHAENPAKEKTFTKTAFLNWETAIQTDRGFNNITHQNSEFHIQAMAN
jgi:hypothetical protein